MILKYSVFLCLFLFGLTAVTCQREPQSELFGKTWLHAQEEDEGDIKVYRPNTYTFPPSRGRTGFAFEKDNVFRLFAIAPTDGLEEHAGRWELIKKDLLQVTFPEDESRNFDLALISVTPDVIKVKRLPSSK